MKTGIELIAAERKRQIEEEGWTLDRDTGYTNDELARAGAIYAMPNKLRDRRWTDIPAHWPWADSWWKPTPNERIRELVKAGALIAAEIDRLHRLEATNE